jgi:O-Antigen ligase
MTTPNSKPHTFATRITNVLVWCGFLIYAIAAPHSIAISWVGISLLVLGWLIRTIVTRRLGIQRSPMDLPLLLFIAWTVLSSILSIEPRDSLPKLINVSTFLFFYLTQSLLTHKLAVAVAGVMILSAAAGVLWGAGELILGRGVIVTALSTDSPLRSATPLTTGDVIWRVNNRRVSTVDEINDGLRRTCAGCTLRLSVISRGEHAEWTAALPNKILNESNPSGVTGGGRTHRFRASGWTRHYETFAEVLQIIAQFALGFAIVNWKRSKDTTVNVRKLRKRALLAAIGFAIVAIGIPLTAMRSTLAAVAVGALVIAWRMATTQRQRIILAAAVVVIFVGGGWFVWRTREQGALALQDASANLRYQVATIAARRVMLHPIFGHGMDAMHEHWNEWGFPGRDMLDAHSTPIQIAFDRGLPALALWFWLMFSFWRFATRTERLTAQASDASTHGLSIGIVGAFAGFVVSSMVNYNFGDSEVVLLVWWMMGATVVLNRSVLSYES